MGYATEYCPNLSISLLIAGGCNDGYVDYAVVAFPRKLSAGSVQTTRSNSANARVMLEILCRFGQSEAWSGNGGVLVV